MKIIGEQIAFAIRTIRNCLNLDTLPTLGTPKRGISKESKILTFQFVISILVLILGSYMLVYSMNTNNLEFGQLGAGLVGTIIGYWLR